MAGVMALRSRDDAVSLLDSAKFAIEVPSKLHHLSRFKRDLSSFQSDLLLSQLLQLLSDRSSPVRKLVTQIIGEIGSKHVHLLPQIVPALLAVLQDAAPAVSRQAITCALDLFRSTLGRVAVQGLLSGKLEDSLESSWVWMLKLKEKIYSIASQPESDGIRLLALKFVQAIILLYTPDPNGSSEPPSQEAFEGKLVEFNISWLRGGHPLLDMGDLSIEASQSLDSLLDHLRLVAVKSLSNSMIIVLINGLSAIANKRPAFYGRILPVLLGLNPASTVIKGVRVSAAHHALKNAFLSCLKCTHPGALPWRDRLAGALGQMEGGHTEGEIFPLESKLNGQAKEEINVLPLKEGEKPSVKSLDVVHGNANGKRLGGQDIFQSTVDTGSGKRVKTTPIVSEGLSKELNKDINVHGDASSTGRNTSQGDGVNGPVQQLVAMFGALVAQGDKAASSLEILISSISSDLLAEVVMANMRNLPHDFSSSERIMGNDALGKIPSSISADILLLSNIFPQMVSQLDDQPMESIEVSKCKREEECFALTSANSVEVCGAMNVDTEAAVVNSVPVMSTSFLASGMEKDYSIIPHEIQDAGNLDSGIPGLDAADHSEGFPNTLVASSLASTDLEDGCQDQASGVNRSPHDQLPSVSTDRSEELSPKASVTDVNSTISSSATSVGMCYQIILPKMAAPVIDLADEQKDHLQNLAFSRIIEAYKQISLGGGSHVHFCLLASLGVQFPLELDPWKLLQKHILSDYVNHEGHELTLHVLYRLFSEAEEERDFFSSATATSSYDMFLGTVAETLRDSFPASDKSLSRLLGEVPYLPQSIFKLLECMCSPENNDKDDKGLQCGDRVTQGLFAVWSLILIRPSIRNVCLKIALKSAVHNLEEVRMKAIRLVANKLYPMISIAQHIEEFALENLFSVSNGSTIHRADVERIRTESHRDSNLEKPVDEHKSLSVCTKDVSSETESCVSESKPSSSISEAQRCMSLYFALCTKKHTLFRQIFVIYRRMSEAAKQAVDRHIPILVRTIGSSPDLLEIISDPPIGSENLLMQVLCTLTDGVVPPPALTFTIKKLYDSKLKDIGILMPILPFLPKEEVLQFFPKIVNVPQEKFQDALSCVMQGSIQSGPVLTPAEVLIAIHGIDPERDGIPLKKITDACNACFEQRKLFTQQVIAMVLNQLVEQIPLPLLFMRTVLQAIGFFPALVDFIMEILCRLVSKQIWKYPKLWVGFLKCAFLTKPQSFSVLLQLPPAQLENALNKNAALKAPLVAHVNQSDVRSTLPRSLLVVLGVALDSQTSSQTEVTQTQPDARSPAKEVIAEKTVESSSAS